MNMFFEANTAFLIIVFNIQKQYRKNSIQEFKYADIYLKSAENTNHPVYPLYNFS